MVDIARPLRSPRNSVIPLGPCARASLRVSPAAIAGITIFARKLDVPINTVAGDGERMNVRLGPDEWLLIAPEDEGENFAREVAASLGGSFFSLVDISHRNAAFQVVGRHAREVLAGGCPLDLDDATFPAGSATRTVLGKAEIVLIRPQTECAYRAECLRSFGPYVRDFLNELIHEFEET